jgi:hypothetical protein
LCQRFNYFRAFVCDAHMHSFRARLVALCHAQIFKSCRGNKKIVHAVPNAIFPFNCVYVHVITAGGMIKRRMASGHYHTQNRHAS